MMNWHEWLDQKPYTENIYTDIFTWIYLAAAFIFLIVAMTHSTSKIKTARDDVSGMWWINPFNIINLTFLSGPRFIFPFITIMFFLECFGNINRDKKLKELESQGVWQSYNIISYKKQKKMYLNCSPERQAEIQAHIASLPEPKIIPIWLKAIVYFGTYGAMLGILMLLSMIHSS